MRAKGALRSRACDAWQPTTPQICVFLSGSTIRWPGKVKRTLRSRCLLSFSVHCCCFFPDELKLFAHAPAPGFVKQIEVRKIHVRDRAIRKSLHLRCVSRRRLLEKSRLGSSALSSGKSGFVHFVPHIDLICKRWLLPSPKQVSLGAGAYSHLKCAHSHGPWRATSSTRGPASVPGNTSERIPTD